MVMFLSYYHGICSVFIVMDVHVSVKMFDSIMYLLYYSYSSYYYYYYYYYYILVIFKYLVVSTDPLEFGKFETGPRSHVKLLLGVSLYQIMQGPMFPQRLWYYCGYRN